MLKLVKAVSVLVVLLAAVTVATVGYFMVFGNDAGRQRGEFLSKKSTIEAFRDLIDAMPEAEIQISPLVEQAHILALRIDPPPPPPSAEKIERAEKSQAKKPVKPTIAPPSTPVNVRFNLLATCQYTDHPEKSLALMDLSAKGHKWVREGDSIEHLTVNRINDGSIVLYQGTREHSVLEVPKEPTSSLLKVPTAKVSDNRESAAAVEHIEKSSPDVDASYRPLRTSAYRERKLPERPSAEEQAAMQKDSKTKMKEMIQEVEAGPTDKEQAEALATMAEILKFLEESTAEIERAEKSADKKSNEKNK